LLNIKRKCEIVKSIYTPTDKINKRNINAFNMALNGDS
jgi:hypothetical protein